MGRRGMEGRWSWALPRGVGVPDHPAIGCDRIRRDWTSRDWKGINGNPNLSGSGDLQVARPIPPAGLSTCQRGSHSPGGEGPVRTGSGGAGVYPIPSRPCHRSGCASRGRRPGMPGEADQGASRSPGDGERKSPRRVDSADSRWPRLGRDGDGVSGQIVIHPQKSRSSVCGGQFDLRDRGDVGADDHGSTR